MKKDMELEALLKQYTSPEIDSRIRSFHMEQLSRDIRKMDYLPQQSFIGQILTQLSFIPGWVWLSQAAMLILLYYCVFLNLQRTMNLLLSCLAPALSLILTCELSKSFRAGIWEMETSCRYNLAQIFFFRLCILLGGDFLVLTAALAAYRMVDGLLWQFCLYALLPFFLTSGASLYVLRRIGNRCNTATLTVVPVMVGMLHFLVIPNLTESLSRLGISLSKSMPAVTLLALLALLYNAVKLCAKTHYLNENRKDHNAWNYE